MATTGWQNLFPSFDVRHFAAYKSDHSPIMLNSHDNHMEQYSKKISLWLSKEECKSVVEDVWVEGLGADIEFVLKIVLQSSLSRPIPPLVCYAKE